MIDHFVSEQLLVDNAIGAYTAKDSIGLETLITQYVAFECPPLENLHTEKHLSEGVPAQLNGSLGHGAFKNLEL